MVSSPLGALSTRHMSAQVASLKQPAGIALAVKIEPCHVTFRLPSRARWKTAEMAPSTAQAQEVG